MAIVKGTGLVSFMKQGVGITSVKEYYLATSASSGVTRSTMGWQADTVPAITETNKYLWNYEETVFSDGRIKYVEPHIVRVFGKDGNGISYIVNYYLATDKSEGVGLFTPGWTDVVQKPTAEKRYLWNYERVYYTNGTYDETTVHIIGVYGETGADGEPGPQGPPGNDGKPGADGSPGPYVPLPRYWRDYPDNYYFQCGASGEERKDVVLYEHQGKIYYLSCKTSHWKQSFYEPFGSNSALVWETGQQWDFIATKLLLAELARVNNLCAEFIQMLDANGNIVFQALGGDVTCNKGTFRNVDVYGRLVAGEHDGQRIVVDPATKAVVIYDDSGNECSRLDGTSYTSDSVMPSGGTALALSYNGAQSMYAYGSASQPATSTKIFTSRSSLTSVGKLQVSMAAQVHATPASASGSGSLTMISRGLLYCLVSTYNSSGVCINTERVLITQTAEAVDGSLSSPSVSKVFSVSVPAGYHQVSFELVGTGGTASASVTLSAASFIADQFMSRFFANGFALVQNSLNYLIALYENARMKLMLGGDFYIDRVKQPRVVYAARVSDGSTKASDPCTTQVLTYLPGYSVSAVKTTTEGLYTITLPAAYGLHLTNSMVRLTGYGRVADGGSRPSKATVKSYTRQSTGAMLIEVWVSDDDSLNYGGFEIEVLKF